MKRSRTTSRSSASRALTILVVFGFVMTGLAAVTIIARSGYGSSSRIAARAVIVWHSWRKS